MRFTRGLLILLVLATASTAFAAVSDYIRFDQISPDSRTFITATIEPTLSCDSKPATVTISGSTVAINVDYYHGLCIATWTPVSQKANIGLLPGGTYDVIVTGAAKDPQQTTLVVRGVDPKFAVPAGGPTSGGNRIFVMSNIGVPFDIGGTVTFGGVAVDPHLQSDGSLWFIAPPHAAGDVDLIETVGGAEPKTYVVRNAYRYYDAAAARPDPFVFEPLLFPIAYEGAGAFGSTWTTSSTLAVSSIPWITPGFALFWKPPCSSCSAVVDAWDTTTRSVDLDKTTDPAGKLLYVARGTAEGVVTSSHIHDLSRQTQSAGVDIPVVRERDFKTNVMLQNVPTDPRFRVMLRVWALAEQRNVSIGVRAGGKAASAPVVTLTRTTADGPFFGSADLTSSLSTITNTDRATVLVGSSQFRYGNSGVWAMVSITNNETQEVTIVVPH